MNLLTRIKQFEEEYNEYGENVATHVVVGRYQGIVDGLNYAFSREFMEKSSVHHQFAMNLLINSDDFIIINFFNNSLEECIKSPLMSIIKLEDHFRVFGYAKFYFKFTPTTSEKWLELYNYSDNGQMLVRHALGYPIDGFYSFRFAPKSVEQLEQILSCKEALVEIAVNENAEGERCCPLIFVREMDGLFRSENILITSRVDILDHTSLKKPKLACVINSLNELSYCKSPSFSSTLFTSALRSANLNIDYSLHCHISTIMEKLKSNKATSEMFRSFGDYVYDICAANTEDDLDRVLSGCVNWAYESQVNNKGLILNLLIEKPHSLYKIAQKHYPDCVYTEDIVLTEPTKLELKTYNPFIVKYLKINTMEQFCNMENLPMSKVLLDKILDSNFIKTVEDIRTVHKKLVNTAYLMNFVSKDNIGLFHEYMYSAVANYEPSSLSYTYFHEFFAIVCKQEEVPMNIVSDIIGLLKTAAMYDTIQLSGLEGQNKISLEALREKMGI